MPFQRRSRLTALLTFLLFIIIVYIRTGEKQTRTSDFYTRTNEALERADAAPVDNNPSYAEKLPNSDVSDRLSQAEKEAKEKANAKGEDFFGDRSKSIILEEDDAQRQRQSSDQKILESGNGLDQQSIYEESGVAKIGNADASAEKSNAGDDDRKTDEEYELNAELNSILKKGPSM